MRRILLVTLVLSLVLMGAGYSKEAGVVFLPVKDDPTVSFRILFNIGSQNDPAGKEGLAALTATMLSEGSTKRHSYEELTALLYPMAASIGDQVDKEMTVFYGRTHLDNLAAFYALFKEVLIEPAFLEEDFSRVKNDYLNYVKTSLRYSQDEELGKETLYETIFTGTPYHHIEEGWVQSLTSITLDDVRAFYAENYTQANLVIGLGGGFDDKFAKQVKTDLGALPKGKAAKAAVIKPAAIDGMQVTIVEKDAISTGINFGFPIDVKRGSREFYALAMACSWLGEHRSQFSHLFDVIREKRGLNYGDYSYIEHFPGGHFRQFPPANVARNQQIFQVWIRPVPHETRVFAFRAALRELESIVDNGMTQEDFELTRKFLKGYTLHYAPTTMMKLGYALDDHFYGIKDGHWATYSKMLDEITLEEVNAALKKYLNYQNIKVVFVTNEAEALREALVSNAPSPITYESEKPAAVLEEDKLIEKYPLAIKADNVKIVKVDELFEG